MDAGPDALPGTEHEPRLGAVPPGEADLGPISPELALVDPELARRARALLPEPGERPRAPRPPVPAPVLEPPPPEIPTEHEPEQRRGRWPRALLLAAAIFAAGAASGTFLHTDDAGTPATALEVLAGAPTTQPRPAPQPPAKKPPLRPPTVTSKRRPKTKASVPRQRRRHASVVRAANVLGVSAQAGRRGVELEWQRPAASSHVVVARTRAPGGKRIVVYRGWATSYRDASAKACAAYRYTIVNYDRRGRPSTGVPTSISTRCGG